MAREWTEEQKEEARQREKARRATQQTENQETVEPETQADPNATLLALINDLTAKIGTLESKLQQKDAAAPRMIPMGAMDVPSIGTAAAGLKAGESRDGVGAQLPITARGLRLHDDVYRQFEQHFETGQQVRINPDVTRDGSSKTWAEILERLNQNGGIQCPTKVGRSTCKTRIQVGETCRRCGVGPTIAGVRYLSKAGEWKYIVRVPGMTSRQGKGDGFAQSELLPA